MLDTEFCYNVVLRNGFRIIFFIFAGFRHFLLLLFCVVRVESINFSWTPIYNTFTIKFCFSFFIFIMKSRGRKCVFSFGVTELPYSSNISLLDLWLYSRGKYFFVLPEYY